MHKRECQGTNHLDGVIDASMLKQHMVPQEARGLYCVHTATFPQVLVHEVH